MGVKRLKYYVRIYFWFIAQDIKGRMQYRVDFFISIVGMLMTNLLGLLSIYVIFRSIPNILGWSYYEILFIYGFSLLSLSPLQLFFDNLWNLPYYLITGDFIKYYLKPLNIFFFYFAEVFDIKGLSQLITGIIILSYSWIKLNLEFSFLKLLLLIISILSGSLVMISLMVIGSTVAFWVLNVTPLLNFIFRLREYTKYPVDIFDPFFKFVFSFLIPIAFVSFYPSQIFLRHQSNKLLVFISPFVGIFLFIVAYKFWMKETRRYKGTGV
jgi:ABC-2 type transport system permease protein